MPMYGIYLSIVDGHLGLLKFLVSFSCFAIKNSIDSLFFVHYAKD